MTLGDYSNPGVRFVTKGPASNSNVLCQQTRFLLLRAQSEKVDGEKFL